MTALNHTPSKYDITASWTENAFLIAGHLLGESIGHIWIPSQKVQRYCPPGQTVEGTVELLVIAVVVSDHVTLLSLAFTLLDDQGQ